jgi:flagellar motor switch protein FliM
MSTATKDYPSSGLRVSDADRDRVIAELSEHFQAGRLTVEELEDRTGRALQARTAGELAELFTDLPRRQAAVTGTSPTPARVGSFRPARVPVPVPIAIIAVVVLGSILSGHPALIALVPVLVILIVRRLAGGRGARHPGDRTS